MNLYSVNLESHDSGSTPAYFSGPEMSKEDFNKLCDGLVANAGSVCLEKDHISELEGNEKSYIKMDDIMEEVYSQLIGRGFSKLNFTEATYWDMPLSQTEVGFLEEWDKEELKRLLGSSFGLILKHNQEVQDEYQKQLKSFQKQ